MKRPNSTGRGSQINPPNRFERIEVAEDFEHLEYDEEARADRHKVRTEYFVDTAKSILSENDSPDVPFRFSLNPYRGCSHGCSYCYARPTHEYFGLSAGLDFETKVFVKTKAAALLRERLSERAWKPETIMFSGVTDCYQPAERTFRLTRQCLEVALEARQPICIVTKNALITRDIDLLAEMASRKLASVAISITTLDQSLCRVMEPRTSGPAARLRAISDLCQAGIPTSVMLAPIIPGLTDIEIPALLQAAKEHGAMWANYILLRLPWTVQPVFLEWLERTQPSRKDAVESRIRDARDGKWNDPNFRSRMRGTGELADQISQTFRVFARRFGLDDKPPALDASQFRPPTSASGQRTLF